MSRGGILAGSAAAALLAAGVVRRAGEQGVNAQAKKEAPLETKEDASVRPWKRYAGLADTRLLEIQHTRQCSLAAGAERSRARFPVRLPAMPRKGPRWWPTAIAAVHVWPAM